MEPSPRFLQSGGIETKTATLDQPEHGLTDEVLAATDVLSLVGTSCTWMK